jgi:hypothetical protein
MKMDIEKKCRIRIHLRRYINDHIHRASLYLTEARKRQMQIAFIQHLRLIGVLETEEEIKEIENLTRVFLNQHHQLQERFGLAFVKREVESEGFSD